MLEICSTLLQGFPIVDDGNKQDYFCALRLLIDSKVSDQYKLFPQSARTRCVRPLVSNVNGMAVGYAKWNEVFIFEVPEKVGMRTFFPVSVVLYCSIGYPFLLL